MSSFLMEKNSNLKNGKKVHQVAKPFHIAEELRVVSQRIKHMVKRLQHRLPIGIIKPITVENCI